LGKCKKVAVALRLLVFTRTPSHITLLPLISWTILHQPSFAFSHSPSEAPSLLHHPSTFLTHTMTHRADPTGHTGPTAVPSNVFFTTTGDSGASDDSSQQQQQQEQGQWPSLLNIRQFITAFILETITNARPLRDK
jgi:hypothetical protein